jgi:SAM-dependent methyltransferase
MRSKLWKTYSKLEEMLIPGRIEPQFAYRDLVLSHINRHTRWLDLGCGHKAFSGIGLKSEDSISELIDRANLVVGIDRDLDALQKNKMIKHRIFGDILELPFKKGTFNLITANMVIEHASDPQVLLAEIKRVLTNDGICVFHTPNSLSYKIMLARLFPDRLKKLIIRYLQNRGGRRISNFLSLEYT